MTGVPGSARYSGNNVESTQTPDPASEADIPGWVMLGSRNCPCNLGLLQGAALELQVRRQLGDRQLTALDEAARTIQVLLTT